MTFSLGHASLLFVSILDVSSSVFPQKQSWIPCYVLGKVCLLTPWPHKRCDSSRLKDIVESDVCRTTQYPNIYSNLLLKHSCNSMTVDILIQTLKLLRTHHVNVSNYYQFEYPDCWGLNFLWDNWLGSQDDLI